MAFNDLHIANSWSVAIWLKPGRDTADETILDLRSDGSNENRIRVEKLGTVSNDPLQITLYDSAGAEFKRYRYESVVPAGEWQLVLFTWNGTTLTAYADGAAVAASSTPTNTTGTMASSLRSVTVGADYAHTAFFQGYVHSVGLWSSVLAADEVTKLYDLPLIWWRQDDGDYVSATDLQHWWRLGEPTRNDFEGTTWVVDAGYAPEGIDLSVGAANVTDADIVAEVPSVFYVSGTVLNMFGSSEYLQNTTQQDLGITNAFTIAISFLRDNSNMASGPGCYLDIAETTGNENRIQIGSSPSGTSRLNVVLYDSAGVKFKDYGFSNINNGNGDHWINLVMSWDGTDLTVSLNGLVTTPDVLTTDTTGTLTNTNRGIHCGITKTGASESAILLHTVAMWNECITDAEMNEVSTAMDANDLSVDYGAYASSANLIHYWRAGVPATGTQSGTTYICDYLDGPGIDIAASAVGMSDADILADDAPYRPSVTAHALDFDGSSYVLSNGNANLKTGAEQTLKFTVYSDRDTHDETIFEFKVAANNNSRVLVQKLGTVANDPLRIAIWTSIGTAYKDYSWNNVIPSGSWRSFVLVISSAADTMVLYDHTGTPLTPDTITTDASSAIGNQARTVAFGAGIDGSNPFDGRIRQIAQYDDNLSAAGAADIAPHNYDLMVQTANYPFTRTAGVGNIAHWWLLGKPGSAVINPTNAVDYLFDYNPNGNAQIDFSASVNISAADIVAVIPS